MGRLLDAAATTLDRWALRLWTPTVPPLPSAPSAGVPYGEMDPPVVGLVRLLNRFPGISTIGSCAGHGGEGLPADRWFVSCKAEPSTPDDVVAVPTRQAWVSLEFLSWAINRVLAESHDVELVQHAPPPYLNRPGRGLSFLVSGSRKGERGITPDDAEHELAELASEVYVPAEDVWAA